MTGNAPSPSSKMEGNRSIMNPNIREVALQVADALDNPDTWCAGEMARDAAGNSVEYDAPTAMTWCAYGHASRLVGEVVASELAHAYMEHFGTAVSADNDERGREYVRARLLELARVQSESGR
jgi:hypothetical protein